MDQEPLSFTDNALVIETSGKWLVAGLCNEDGCISEEKEASRSGFTGLFPAIQRVLDRSRVSKPDWIICTTGPGSFTGVRIGILAARSMGQLLGIPVFPIPTLDAFACSIYKNQPGSTPGTKAKPFAIMLDAKQQKVYAKSFPEGQFGDERDCTPSLAHPALDVEPQTFLKSLPNTHLIFADDPQAILSCLDSSGENPPATNIQQLSGPKAKDLYSFAMQSGGKAKAVLWDQVTPVYLRGDPATTRYPEGFQRNIS